MDYNRVKVAKSANVVKEAVLLGDVTVGEDCCILFHAVLRGDEDRIVVGKCSNIQDNCTVHADVGYPAVIGDYVTVGHNALVHGCRRRYLSRDGLDRYEWDSCRQGVLDWCGKSGITESENPRWKFSSGKSSEGSSRPDGEGEKRTV